MKGYMVMKVHAWDAVSVTLFNNKEEKLSKPIDGPDKFIPVFETREKAEAWDTDGDGVIEISLLEREAK